MSTVLLGIENEQRFRFGNCKRNDLIVSECFEPKQTGTTICGITFAGGVVLGADSRAVPGNFAYNCEKINCVQKNIFCCGAGTATETSQVADYVSSNMNLIRMNTNRKFVPVRAAVQVFKQYFRRCDDHVQTHLIIGGVDNEGPHLYSRGLTDQVPYAAMGSGHLATMSVLQSRWNRDMTEPEAVALVCDAIIAGASNKLGSGLNIDLCVVRKDSNKIIRDYKIATKKEDRKLNCKRRTTGILSNRKSSFDSIEEGIDE